MNSSGDELRFAMVSKLVELLRDDEAGWYDAASRIDHRAIEEGIRASSDDSLPTPTLCAAYRQRIPKRTDQQQGRTNTSIRYELTLEALVGTRRPLDLILFVLQASLISHGANALFLTSLLLCFSVRTELARGDGTKRQT